MDIIKNILTGLLPLAIMLAVLVGIIYLIKTAPVVLAFIILGLGFLVVAYWLGAAMRFGK